MIGIGKELLFYEMLQARWYVRIGVTQKRAEKVRASLLRGKLLDATIDKYLTLLGYKQVRPSFVVDAVYKRKGYYVDEHTAMLAATSVRDWWVGLYPHQCQGSIIRSNVRHNRAYSEAVALRILSAKGYVRVRPRIVLPCIYEKPSDTSARAYTKTDLLDSVIMDDYEYKSVRSRQRYRALPFQRNE